MENNYRIRKANNKKDLNQIVNLLNQVFNPEKVGSLGEVLTNYLPGFSFENWLVAEEKTNNDVVSALCLIPWKWEMNGVEIKFAEMGLVGTHPKYQGKGLMRLINKEFDKILQAEKYDLVGIQGIPGFYQKFGYNYSLEMENHLNLNFNDVKTFSENKVNVRSALKNDIKYLLSEDVKFQKDFLLTSKRTKEHFEYILTEGKKTEYSSEILIFEMESKKAYCRILNQGFGKGFIISELSGELVTNNLDEILEILKFEAIKREKPFFRFNINRKSVLALELEKRNVKFGKSYAWQMKFPNKLSFLKKVRTVLQDRISNSQFLNFTGTLRLDLYLEQIDIKIQKGNIESIQKGSKEELELTFNIPDDLFVALILGHRSWEELQYNRPDLCSMAIILFPDLDPLKDKSAELINVLFPKKKSWINLEY